MKKGWIWGIIILIIVLIVIYYFNQKQSAPSKRISKSISVDGEDKILTYRLPTSMDTEVFGKHYWGALHNLVENIPCSICRNDAIDLMEGMHNLVNSKLEKPIYKPEKFEKFLANVCEIKAEREKAKKVAK